MKLDISFIARQSVYQNVLELNRLLSQINQVAYYI
jgi:hypothetical protein